MVCEHCGEDIPEGYGIYELPGETAVCEECLYSWARGFFKILLAGEAEEARYGTNRAR